MSCGARVGKVADLECLEGPDDSQAVETIVYVLQL